MKKGDKNNVFHKKQPSKGDFLKKFCASSKQPLAY
jgi:hypothetical protein